MVVGVLGDRVGGVKRGSNLGNEWRRQVRRYREWAGIEGSLAPPARLEPGVCTPGSRLATSALGSGDEASDVQLDFDGSTLRCSSLPRGRCLDFEVAC